MTRILVFLEATTVTGPAKNLLEFHRHQKQAAEPIQIEIALFHRGSDRQTDFVRAAAAAELPVHYIPERFAFDRRVLPQMQQLIDEVRPDLLQTHSIKSHFLLRLSGEWKRRPWVAFHHGYTFTAKRLYIYNQLDRWSLRRAIRVVTVSQSFARDLVRLGVVPDRIRVLHNAIDVAWGEQARDPELRSRTRQALGLLDTERAVLIVGRLSLEKSHVQLVKAIAQLRTKLPEVRAKLLIVGEGPERLAIEQAAQECGLKDQVIFVGYTADVRPYYAAADLAVLASKTEGSPNALLEAMAASVPVVATSVGGIPEIVTHEVTALLVPPSQTEDLAAALARSFSDSAEAAQRARRAHELILEQYTPQRRAHMLGALYADVGPIARNKPA